MRNDNFESSAKIIKNMGKKRTTHSKMIHYGKKGEFPIKNRRCDVSCPLKYLEGKTFSSTLEIGSVSSATGKKSDENDDLTRGFSESFSLFLFRVNPDAEKLLYIPKRHFADRIGAKSWRKLISGNTRYGKKKIGRERRETRDFAERNVFRFIIFRARNNS